MNIYYILYILFFILSAIEVLTFKNKGTDKSLFTPIYCIISFLIYFIGSFRNEVGTDWESYKVVYSQILNFKSTTNDFEPLFQALMIIFKSLYLNFFIFIGVVFFLAFTSKLLLIFKLSPFPILSLLVYFQLYFLVYDLNGIRQGLAMGITFFSIYFIYKKNIIPFILLVLTATLLHYSAIIFLMAYYIFHIRLNKFKWIVIIFSLTVVGFLMQIAVKEFAQQFGIVDVLSLQKIYSYAQDDQFNQSLSFGFSYILKISILGIILLTTHKKEGTLINGLLNIYICYFIILSLLSAFELIGSRLSLYYRISEVVLIPLLIYENRSRLITLILFSTFIVLYFFSIKKVIDVPQNGLTPYKNVFINE